MRAHQTGLWHILTVGLSLVAISSLPVAAEPGGQAGDQKAGDDVILVEGITVTATRQLRAGFEVPQDVTVMGREEIDRQLPPLLPDYLRGKEGVYIQETTPGQASPIVRGLMGSEILVLVDGMRLNTAFFRPAPNNVQNAMTRADETWGKDYPKQECSPDHPRNLSPFRFDSSTNFGFTFPYQAIRISYPSPDRCVM